MAVLRRLRVELGTVAAALLQIGMLIVAVSRGADYISLPASLSPESLTLVEKALPFDVWGWLFLLGGVVGLVGLVAPRAPITALAHALLCGLYLAFGVGALAQVADRGFLYGWRTGVGFVLGAALVHLVLADASVDGWRRARAR